MENGFDIVSVVVSVMVALCICNVFIFAMEGSFAESIFTLFGGIALATSEKWLKVE